MKYKVGEYLAGKDTGLFRISVALEGISEYYGLVTIKNQEMQWFSLEELEHEGIGLTVADIDHFKKALIGDFVDMYAHRAKILARSGTALLLSRAHGGGNDFTDNPMVKLVSALEEQIGDEIIPQETRQHMRKHGSSTYKVNVADNWYDETYMALMNWKLIKEGE